MLPAPHSPPSPTSRGAACEIPLRRQRLEYAACGLQAIASMGVIRESEVATRAHSKDRVRRALDVSSTLPFNLTTFELRALYPQVRSTYNCSKMGVRHAETALPKYRTESRSVPLADFVAVLLRRSDPPGVRHTGSRVANPDAVFNHANRDGTAMGDDLWPLRETNACFRTKVRHLRK